MTRLSDLLDERFLSHRQRSTSSAGLASTLLATGLFGYRYFVEHTWSWDLFAVIVVFAAIKLALRLWYAFSD